MLYILTRVVTALKYAVKAKCLARKVIKWYDETQGNGQDLRYRFTGKESRLFCHNFMRLVKWLSSEKDSKHQRQTVLIYAYVGLKLRDCVSIFNRFDITAEQLSRSAVVAREYLSGECFISAFISQSHCLDNGAHHTQPYTRCP